MPVEFVDERGAKIKYTGRLIITSCWCGMPHGVPEELYDHVQSQKRNGRKQTGIFCPLGHVWIFSGEGEADQLRRQLETERQVTESKRRALETEKRSHAATKGKLTKTKNRIAKGVCPCCNRSFVQLERHMKTQHPDFTDTIS